MLAVGSQAVLHVEFDSTLEVSLRLKNWKGARLQSRLGRFRARNKMVRLFMYSAP